MRGKLLAFVTVATLLVGSLLMAPRVRAVDTNNFTITSYDAAMTLGRDSERRSTLQVKETITADFPQFDQNHGLEWAFVKEYDGHSISLKLQSVKDENGKSLGYHWDGDNLRIGDGDTYVHGLQTYVISYSMRDVTRFFEDTDRDEFYWDMIGTDWQMPIQAASVRLAIDPSLRGALTGDSACYSGVYGSTTSCSLQSTDEGFSLTASNLRPREGVTVAIGFTKGTFAEYQPSLLDKLLSIWIVLMAVTTILGIAGVIWASIRAYRWSYRDADMGTIVPEYLPPKNASVTVSSSVSPGYRTTMAAQLTDLAVRHYIQIIETRAKSFWRPAEYDIKIIRDVSDLRAEEREILSDMFGHEPKVGDRLALSTLRNNTAAYLRFSDNDKKITELLRTTYNFKEKNEEKRAWFGELAKVFLVVAIATLNPFLLIAWLVLFVLGKTFWALSDEGLALRRYLKGLELYIKVAEKDRIKMLQSPEGAEKVGVKDPTDPAKIVKLYERVLPYAILFGQEKEWSKRLGDYYESANSHPDWYTGNTAFNAAVFSSMMTNFSGAVSTTSVSSSSSSSGGSGGGGFSGGGGGGGGGGGW